MEKLKKYSGIIAAIFMIVAFCIYYAVGKEFPEFVKEYSVNFRGLYFVMVCFGTALFSCSLYFENKGNLIFNSIYLLCGIFFSLCFMASFLDWIVSDQLSMNSVYYCWLGAALLTLIHILLVASFPVYLNKTRKFFKKIHNNTTSKILTLFKGLWNLRFYKH